jgi:putative ABC transport system ATP-binding protein
MVRSVGADRACYHPGAMATPLIELRNLAKSYDEGGRRRRVLCDTDLSIGRGELAVLIGRSGTGKSTLLNLLSGIDQPSAGEVVIDGVAISSLPERQRTLFRRDRIGFVFQFFNLIPTLTVEENLLLPMELKGRVGRRQRGRRSEAAAYPAGRGAARRDDQQIAAQRGELLRHLLLRALAESHGQHDRGDADQNPQ